jgi:hypothetical protein
MKKANYPEKLRNAINLFRKINKDCKKDDPESYVSLKAKNSDFYEDQCNNLIDEGMMDEEEKNLFLGWLSQQK